MKAKASTYFLIFFLASTQTLGNYEWDFISGSGRDFLEWCWFHRGGHCKSKRPPPACWFAPPIYLGGFENQTCLPPCFGRNHVKTDFLIKYTTLFFFGYAFTSSLTSELKWKRHADVIYVPFVCHLRHWGHLLPYLYTHNLKLTTLHSTLTGVSNPPSPWLSTLTHRLRAMRKINKYGCRWKDLSRRQAHPSPWHSRWSHAWRAAEVTLPDPGEVPARRASKGYT
jgi:hypothetical protein